MYNTYIQSYKVPLVNTLSLYCVRLHNLLNNVFIKCVSDLMYFNRLRRFKGSCQDFDKCHLVAL